MNITGFDPAKLGKRINSAPEFFAQQNTVRVREAANSNLGTPIRDHMASRVIFSRLRIRMLAILDIKAVASYRFLPLYRGQGHL
jgi:hypothetical protein